MPSFRIATPAIRDLDQIWGYYYSVANEEVADRLLDRVYSAFLVLVQQPNIGRSRPELAPNLRSYVVPNTRFVIFHTSRDNSVDVVRVIHGSRELTRVFH